MVLYVLGGAGDCFLWLLGPGLRLLAAQTLPAAGAQLGPRLGNAFDSGGWRLFQWADGGLKPLDLADLFADRHGGLLPSSTRR